MGKVLFHGNRKKEKGITLVETIIAIGVIVIVSLATVSIAVYSSTILSNTRVKEFFARETNTLADFYLTYDTEAKFATAVNAYTGREFTGYSDSTFYYDGAFRVSDEEKKSFYLVLDFETNAETGVVTLSMDAFKANGSKILSKEVAK